MIQNILIKTTKQNAKKFKSQVKKDAKCPH